MELIITEQIIKQVTSTVEMYRNHLISGNPNALPLPEKDRWEKWNDNRLWCQFFFSIISPGGSINAKAYLQLIESGKIEFELHPDKLINMENEERILAIWQFGTKDNYLKKRLARFFSKRESIGKADSPEFKLNEAFQNLVKKGFISWFIEIDELDDDRLKAKEIEILPGSKFKVSRDFLNNIGMTDSLIPLDIHTLREMRTKWKWDVPTATPSNREIYEKIEDAVREIAMRINCKVVEIDKAIVSSHNSKMPDSKSYRQ